MNYIEAAILGLVQGLCEFLPVSSSGHLVLFQTLFGMQNPDDNALLVVLLHLATSSLPFWSSALPCSSPL